MKPIVKIISIALCIVMLAVTLCSCQFLDEKKANHAVYCDDKKDSFTFRGYTYRKADLSKSLSLIATNDITNSYLTEQDVPVLLSSRYGEMLSYNTDEQNPIIIECVSFDHDGISYNPLLSYSFNIDLGMDHFDYSYTSNRIFIREDQYDTISENVKNIVFDHYYMIEYNYDDEFYDPDYGYVPDEKHKAIDDDTAKAIRESLKTGKKIKYTEFGDDDFDAIEANQCDKDVLFTNDYGVLLLNRGKSYYLVQLKDHEPISNDVVKVPDQFIDTFKKLFDEYANSTYRTMLINYVFASSDDVTDYSEA